MSNISSTWTSGDADFPIIHLSDGEGREVRIAPAAGFNAFSFRVPHNGQALPILVEPEDDAELRRGGFAFGYPLLFPFPNRLPEGHYSFEGRALKADVNFKDGHAIHGLVCDRPWKVVETGANDERGAWATATFDTRDFPEVQRQYPFSCIVTATYSVLAGELNLAFSAQNVGEGNLPMGFGIHPWFPCPLTEQGERAQCELLVPANARWELESLDYLLPTGNIPPVEGTAYDFRQARALGDIFLDEVYTDLSFDGDWHRSRFLDRQSGLALDMKASSVFREYVVYAPLDRDVICLEPYSGTTNAVNLHNQGVDGGLVVLAPQESWHGEIGLSVSAI